jgi:hypothetical protein
MIRALARSPIARTLTPYGWGVVLMTSLGLAGVCLILWG